MSRVFVTAVLIAIAGLGAGAFLSSAATAADEVKPRQGLWHFHRIMGTQTLDIEECTDPSAKWKQQDAGMAQLGCTKSTPVRSGHTVTFSVSCPKLQTTSHSTMTLTSDSAYTVDIVNESQGRKSTEKLVATRKGDCKAG